MIVNPYKKIIQYTRISLEAYHLNSDIRNNMKLVLKKKVEKKCNKNGYIDEVYRITEYSDGILFAENLNGNVIWREITIINENESIDIDHSSWILNQTNELCCFDYESETFITIK
jgi:tRNA(Ile)-lysidine synthase TilS/MesJ